MKKSIGIKLFTFALLALVVTACSKYEEGSKFTLLTKKARMVNTWTLTSYTVDGDAQTISGTQKYDLQKDGTAVVSWSSGGFTASDTGKWDFNSDKTSVIFTDSNGDTDTFEIVQLKNKDLKLRQIVSGVTGIWTLSGE